MTINDVTKLFKAKFPTYEIRHVKRNANRYVFSIVEAPIDFIDGIPIYNDFFIGYNLETKKWEYLNSNDLNNENNAYNVEEIDSYLSNHY